MHQVRLYTPVSPFFAISDRANHSRDEKPIQSESSGQYYRIDSIIGYVSTVISLTEHRHRQIGSSGGEMKFEYLVRWEGWDIAESTWSVQVVRSALMGREPETHLSNVLDSLFQAFCEACEDEGVERRHVPVVLLPEAAMFFDARGDRLKRQMGRNVRCI